MTEKQFVQKLIEKEMPDIEAVRRTCLARGEEKRNTVWNQKNSPIRKFAVAAACIAAVLCVGSGIGYAATGEAPLELLSQLFSKSDSAVEAQMAQEINAEEQVMTSEEWNLRYTLQYSWYDKEAGTLFMQMEVNTLDGSPIVSWDDIYENGDGVNEDLSEWYTDAADLQSKFESGNRDAVDIYRNAVDTYISENALDMNGIWCGVGSEEVSVNSASSIRIYTVWYNVRNENWGLYDEIILKPSFACDDTDAEFVIRDTGRMTERDIDISSIPNCTDAQLTGAYLTFFFDADSSDSDSVMKNVQWVEITMEDGTVFRGTSYMMEDEPGYEEAMAQNIHLIGMSSIADAEKNMACVLVMFDQIVNVDDIVSVVVNGQECLAE